MTTFIRAICEILNIYSKEGHICFLISSSIFNPHSFDGNSALLYQCSRLPLVSSAFPSISPFWKMRPSALAITLALLAASSTLAAPNYHQNHKSSLATVESTALQRRTAINTGNGNNNDNDNNGDEDEDGLGASEPEGLPDFEGQTPSQIPEEPVDFQGVQREQEEETSNNPSQEDVGPDLSPLSRELTEIVEQQARFMTLLYFQRGIFMENILLIALGREVPYLTESSARQIITEATAPVISADDPESVAFQLAAEQLDDLNGEEVEQQLQAIIQFISDNSDLSQGTAAPNLVQLALNQSRLVANRYARYGVSNYILLARYLRRRNPYLVDEQPEIIAKVEIRKYTDPAEGEELGPSFAERFRRWWRNRGSGYGGGSS